MSKASVRKEAELPVDALKDEEVPEQASYKDVLLNFLETTSSHGLPRIASSRSKIRKVFWLVVFLGALIYFFYSLSGLVSTYRSYPVSVNTKIVPRNLVPFPAVTVCNMNMLKKTKTKESDFFKQLVEIDEQFHKTRKKRSPEMPVELEEEEPAENKRVRRQASDDYDGSGDVEETYYEETYYDDYDDDEDEGLDYNAEPVFNVASDNDFNGFIRESRTPDFSDLVDILRPSNREMDDLGEKRDSFIVMCSFDKHSCSDSDFVDLYNSHYGKCFTFNSGRYGYVNKTSKHGSKYGLRMILNLNVKEYIGFFSPDQGVRLAIHPQNVTPFPQDDGISASPGQKTNIGTQLNEIVRLPSPYSSNCTDGKDYHLNYPGNYTTFACGLTCLEEEVRRTCGCVVSRMGHDLSELCSYANKTEVRCQSRIYQLYSRGDLICDCQSSCSEKKYTSTVSTSSWPTLAYINLLREKRDIQAIKDLPTESTALFKYMEDNLVNIQVYIEDKSISVIEETPAYEWNRLVADMGGLLGLFVGISMCTGVEFLELLLDLIIVACKRAPKRKAAVASSP